MYIVVNFCKIMVLNRNNEILFEKGYIMYIFGFVGFIVYGNYFVIVVL